MMSMRERQETKMTMTMRGTREKDDNDKERGQTLMTMTTREDRH